ncbi:hypothetical protein BJ912DRAFT_503621 [Pholiota molesta]|nr:hypothetical protein BJ912DRAFT_503621 [Pholiota molesta]
MSAFLNQTYDDRDTTVFKYQGAWSTGFGTWNASNVGESGTLASTNDLNANVTFTFPVPAIAFYYYGILRSSGGSYGICVDCDPNKPVFTNVDGFNATDDGKNPPVVLFSQTFSTPGVHEIIMRNQADPRGTPVGNSQLTLDRIDLEVVNPNAQTTVILTNNPTSSTSPTPTSTSGASTATTSPSSSPPIGAIVGGVLGVLALLIGIAILFFWLRLRRKYARAATSNPDPLPTTRPDMQQRYGSSSDPPYTSPSATLTAPSSQWGYGGRTGRESMSKAVSRPTHQPMMPSVSSSLATSSSLTTSSSPPPPPSSSNSGASSAVGARSGPVPGQRRREQDAGPIPVQQEDEEEADEEGTLPPAYGQVFSVGRRSSSRRTLPQAPAPQPGKAPLGTTMEEEGGADGRR